MSLLNTTDTASGANVPDAGATTKWKDYIWVRRLGTSGEAKFYIWNENATSDATYLKWQEKSDVVVSDISMTSGQILVGGSTGLGTSVAMSGDATISNAGAVTVSNIADAAITNAKVSNSAAIAYSKLNLGSSVTNADLAGSIANDKLAGSINQDKLAGSIPWAKLSINDAQIPFGKIDKIFAKNIDVQSTGSNAPNGNASVSGNFPEHSTPTGLAIPNGSQSLEGVYRVAVSSGNSSSTITLPDPSSGAFDGKIFKLSIYRANVTQSKGPVYLRIAGSSPTAGQCTATSAQFTLPSGHGLTSTDKVSIMGVFDSNDRSYEAENTAITISGNTMTYTLPTAAVTSITESGNTATVTTTDPHPFKTDDEVTISGVSSGNASTYNTNHTVTRTGNNTFTMTVSGNPGTGTGTMLVSRSGLGNFTSQRGVVVRSFKLVDNANGVLSDMVEVIPSTNDSVAKKVVLDITCDSRNTGDGQWLVSGHGGMRTNYAKTGTRITVSSGSINAGSNGNITADLDEAVTAGEILTDTATGKKVEVTEDVAAGSGKTVPVKNTGDSAIAANDKLTKPPTRSVEFIAEIGDQMFFDPVTGEFKMPTITWKPKKPGAYGG